MPNKPLQYVIAEHMISICFPVTNENKDGSLSSLCGCVVLFFQHIQIFARIQVAPLSKCNVLKNLNSYYA